MLETKRAAPRNANVPRVMTSRRVKTNQDCKPDSGPSINPLGPSRPQDLPV